MRRRSPLSLLLALCLAMAATIVAIQTSGATAAPIVRDGTTFAKAASSCWRIKQVNPALPSGVYWLQTPALVAPAQFYCDQVTDGGGWVLVGRGREGWSFAQNGQGSASAVRTNVTGPAAFAPAALSGATIDGLLNGAAVSALGDGVRVRRASNLAGTTSQELRLKLASLGAWSWGFGGGNKLSAYSVDGVNYPGTDLHTRDVQGTGNDATRLFTFQWVSHNYRAGWGYGQTMAGNLDPNSYLWVAGGERHPLPFAQVWLRPQLGELSYPAPAAAGAPAKTLSPLMQTTTESTPWGVTGITGGGSGEQNLEVQALAPRGSTMYVGGKFEYVQKGANPAAADKVRQPYIAAFDSNTGAWKPGFRPALDGQVWDIAVTADGKLILAGDFTSVNGAPGTRGLAALNPATGAVLTNWRATLNYASAPASTRGRALDVQGDWLYVGGLFTTVSGGVGAEATANLRNLTRVRISNGQPDTAWRPLFNSGIMELDASPRNDRVYVVGHFTPDADQNYIQANAFAAVTSGRPGTLVPGFKPYVPSTSDTINQYQQIVREYGDYVWEGGSQHNLGRYDRSTFDQVRSFISKTGGDLQAMVEADGVLYAACHCQHHMYSDATTYDGGYPLTTPYSRVDPVLWIGAWDLATGDFRPEFAINGLGTRAGNGPWEMVRDTAGCVWFGGDMDQGTYRNGAYTWLGGFGKVCPRDVKAPTTPASFTGKRTSSGVNLSWAAAADNRGVSGYEVMKDDRVLLWTTGLKYTDSGAAAGSKYWVRAVDAAGNRSATTAQVTP